MRKSFSFTSAQCLVIKYTNMLLSIYVFTLVYGDKLRLQLQVAETSFFLWVAVRSIRNREYAPSNEEVQLRWANTPKNPL